MNLLKSIRDKITWLLFVLIILPIIFLLILTAAFISQLRSTIERSGNNKNKEEQPKTIHELNKLLVGAHLKNISEICKKPIENFTVDPNQCNDKDLEN
jgi:uncharacterized protein involved in cysteine biosynthesis